MRDHVRILGWCFIIYSGIHALVGLFVGVIVLSGGALSGDRQAMIITGAVGTFVAVVLLVLSLPGIAVGAGLLNSRPWARILAIILGVMNLLAFPFGTALGVYALWVLFNAETVQIFEQRAVA